MPRGLPDTQLLNAIRKDRALVLALALLYALVNGFIGFAHAGMAAPGSKAPVLCLTGDDGSSPEGSASAPCDACLLTHAPGLVAHAATLPLPAFIRTVAVLPVSHAPRNAQPVRAPPARGPPALMTDPQPA